MFIFVMVLAIIFFTFLIIGFFLLAVKILLLFFTEIHLMGITCS